VRDRTFSSPLRVLSLRRVVQIPSFFLASRGLGPGRGSPDKSSLFFFFFTSLAESFPPLGDFFPLRGRQQRVEELPSWVSFFFSPVFLLRIDSLVLSSASGRDDRTAPSSQSRPVFFFYLTSSRVWVEISFFLASYLDLVPMVRTVQTRAPLSEPPLFSFLPAGCFRSVVATLLLLSCPPFRCEPSSPRGANIVGFSFVWARLFLTDPSFKRRKTGFSPL